MQLQNSSALGVEVYIFVSMHAMLKKNWLFNFGDDILISRLITTVESNQETWSENIIKFKYSKHIRLSIYETKYSKPTFLVLPRLSYTIFNRPVVGKATLLRQENTTNPLLLLNCKGISISVQFQSNID